MIYKIQKGSDSMGKKVKRSRVESNKPTKVLYTHNGLIKGTYVTVRDNRKIPYGKYKYTVLVETAAGRLVRVPTKQLDT